MFKRKYVVLYLTKIKALRQERKKNKKQRQAQTKRSQQQLNKIIKLLIV